MPSVFILAGEPSGDRIGASLISGLRFRGLTAVSGVGGEAMADQGLSTLFPMRDLAVMGYADVIPRLPRLLWRARQVVQAIMRTKPSVVVLIDAQVFSQFVATRLRRQGYRGAMVLYVAPAVWAWKPERARKIHPLYDAILSVLPFEPKAMAELGGPETYYVGHPALERFPARSRGIDRGNFLLLPGSREGELRRHLPLMQRVTDSLARRDRISEFVIPTPAAQFERVRAATAQWSEPVRIISDEPERLDAMKHAVGAVCVSGTATLELALAGIPHIITYVADRMQVKHYSKARPKWIGLPNIILNADVVPELLFAGRGDGKRVAEAAHNLLDVPQAEDDQVKGFIALRELMEKGAPEAPRVDPVDKIISYSAGAR